MARKNSSDAHREHGFGEVVGIGLTFVAFLLLVALLSYDRTLLLLDICVV